MHPQNEKILCGVVRGIQGLSLVELVLGNTVEKDSGLCYYVVYTSVLYPQAEEGADEPFAVIHGEVFRVADVGEVIHHRKA